MRLVVIRGYREDMRNFSKKCRQVRYYPGGGGEGRGGGGEGGGGKKEGGYKSDLTQGNFIPRIIFFFWDGCPVHVY